MPALIDPEVALRTLYYIPTLHTCAEARGHEGRCSPTCERDEAVLTACWRRVAGRVRMMLNRDDIPYEHVHMFSDGVPRLRLHPGRVWITPAHNRPSPHMAFMRDMADRGALLHGTEDPELIVATGRLLDRYATLPRHRRLNEKRELMRKRDRFIAIAMNVDVPDEHAAICMMGAQHRTDMDTVDIDPTWRVVYYTSFLNLLTPHQYRQIWAVPHQQTAPRR